MKARICLLCLASVAVAFVLAGIPQSRTTGQEKAPNPARAKWEYRMASGWDAKHLNQLGQDGWELVSVTGADSTSAVPTFYLKRQAQ